MKTSNKLFNLLLKLISIILFPVLAAQKVEVPSEVTGFLGNEVTLPCKFIQGPKINDNVTQIQWDFQQQKENKSITIVVVSSQHGAVIHNSTLKNRVTFTNQSLIIKDVHKTDEGSYICSMTTFPSGPFQGTIKLIVEEKKPEEGHEELRAEIVAAVVTASILLLMILVTVAYFIFIKRSQSDSRLQVLIDTSGRVPSVSRPSFIVKEQEVLYSDIKPKRSKDPGPPSDEKLMVQVDDVTYSEVKILYQQRK